MQARQTSKLAFAAEASAKQAYTGDMYEQGS